MKYYIEINEQYRKVFEVEADSEEDAINRVEADYDTGTIMVSDAEMVYVAYTAVRNRQEIEKMLHTGSYSVLPDRPVTYTAEYTLSLILSDTKSQDISCKVEDYESIDAAKKDAASVIAEMLNDHDIPNGTYTLDAGYYSASGEEEPVYEEGILIWVQYVDGKMILEEKLF